MKTFRWVLVVVLLLIALLLGLAIGAFNNGEVTVDLLVTSFTMKLGSVVVSTLFIGLLVGALLVLVGTTLPLFVRLRAANKQLAAVRKAAAIADAERMSAASQTAPAASVTPNPYNGF